MMGAPVFHVQDPNLAVRKSEKFRTFLALFRTAFRTFGLSGFGYGVLSRVLSLRKPRNDLSGDRNSANSAKAVRGFWYFRTAVLPCNSGLFDPKSANSASFSYKPVP